LGMGNDGHTASLFPGSAQLAAATDMNSGKTCMAVTPADAPHERITLTLPAILNAEEIILHLTGSEKKEVLAKARETGPAEEMPVRFILHQQETPVAVYWAA
ncbi:Glucosamine-6-phosphate isomerases/6-phosphogluconolactonase, partial [Candidatus Electrothrix marina]